MCGIAGYIGCKKINSQRIKKGCDEMNHRGPDDAGLFFKDFKKLYVVLGHKRLSIIDLDSRSKQPFYYNNSVLIFNGEIYNYLQIRTELANLGHVFKTSSDTEVLSHALSEWGSKALDKLEGMWALAWFDIKKNELILSRDRFGEKPLYIWKNEEGIFFASEIKALSTMVRKKPTINENHLKRYLVNGYKSLHKYKETFFEEINEISKGKFVRINNNLKINEQTYWKPNYKIDKKLSFIDSKILVRETLIKVVEKQLQADVPLAFCMSGGVDSNTLMAIAKKIFNYDVHGFTVDSLDKRYSEKSMVLATIKDLKIKNTFITPNKKNFLNNLRSLIKSRVSPVYTIANYCHSELMKSISSKGYKVCIGGAGADELFSGYYDHHLFYLRQIQKNKKLFKSSFDNWSKKIHKITRNPFLLKYKSFLKHKQPRDHIFLNNDIFKNFLENSWSEKFKEEKFTKDELRNRMLNEIFHETIPAILHEEDFNSMHYSIENRTPFLDHKLFEVCATIPTEFLINKGRAKSVLRESMKGLVLNDVLRNKQKVGFNASIMELLNLKDRKVRDEILDDSKIFQIVNKKKIEELLKMNSMTNSYSKFLFSFVSAKIFMDINQ